MLISKILFNFFLNTNSCSLSYEFILSFKITDFNDDYSLNLFIFYFQYINAEMKIVFKCTSNKIKTKTSFHLQIFFSMRKNTLIHHFECKLEKHKLINCEK
jgi:hypothetical protein